MTTPRRRRGSGANLHRTADVIRRGLYAWAVIGWLVVIPVAILRVAA